MWKYKLSPHVVNGEMKFKVTKRMSRLTISKKSLRSLNLQRFIIRGSRKITNKEVRDLENKYQRFARP